MVELAELRTKLQHRLRLPPVMKNEPRMPWRFGSYRGLHEALGHGDGMAEVIEVARRDFFDAANASGDPVEYLRVRAAHQNIVVYEMDMLNLPTRAATLYIVGAYQQLESFLRDLVRERGEILDVKTRTKDQDESFVDWALSVLPGGLKSNILRIGKERYAVLDYYRTVRNSFMHTSAKADSGEKAFREAAQWAPVFAADFQLQAPNPVNELTLDDFLLFTRVIKYVATDLCRLSCPTDNDVVDYWLREVTRSKSLRQIDWRTLDEEKSRRRISRFFRNRFRYELNDRPSVLNEIIVANRSGKRASS